MERRKVSAVCVFLVFVAYGARADGYTDLLSMAWDKDAAQAGLDLDLRAAGLALERFEATAGTWQLSAGADPVSIKAAGDAPFSVEAKAKDRKSVV